MKSRSFSISVSVLILFLTGCNVPFVPLIQSDQESQSIQIEEPEVTPVIETEKSQPYAHLKQENKQSPKSKV